MFKWFSLAMTIGLLIKCGDIKTDMELLLATFFIITIITFECDDIKRLIKNKEVK